MKPSITQQYPDEKPDLPPRTRGVIALKQENCTVCWKCSRACPDWCIYIDAHKETHEPASGGKGRSAKILDKFDIDYALCMYCGICVEVCPFDALFWAPDFEYAEYDIDGLLHDKEKLEEWTYKVLPPPDLEEGAEPPSEEDEVPDGVAIPSASAPQGIAAAAAILPGSASASASVLAAPALSAPPVPAAEAPAAGAVPAGAPAPSAPAPHVEPDQETNDRVLAEELAKGSDRRVAEGRAKRAAMIVARRKAGFA
jgi:formate hydrogenlyase subunit 6/NADH:ubiquinone oxidoreductase subunit I